jgi:chromosome segregation ATPase
MNSVDNAISKSVEQQDSAWQRCERLERLARELEAKLAISKHHADSISNAAEACANQLERVGDYRKDAPFFDAVYLAVQSYRASA